MAIFKFEMAKFFREGSEALGMMMGVSTNNIGGNGNGVDKRSEAVEYANTARKGGYSELGLVLEGTYVVKFLIAAQTISQVLYKIIP